MPSNDSGPIGRSSQATAVGHHPPLTSAGFAATRSGESQAMNLRRQLHHEPKSSEPFFSGRAGKAGG